jgi:DNA-binding PadR family transcriptional regulator
MLGWRPMSGYEIKALVDHSTRFFWAASYGQIYPELRRLEEAGLVAGEARPQGARKRTVHRLTPAGRWGREDGRAAEPLVFELREVGLLTLVCAGTGAAESATATLDAKRRRHEEMLARLREVEATGGPEGYAGMVLRFGIEFNEWVAGWCEREGARLASRRREEALA